ncbi:MAG: ROK family protein, partial [Acidobacteriota bacterium]
MSRHYAIGIDLGGTNLRVALVAEDGEILKKIKKPSNEQVMSSIVESIGEIRHDGIQGIGLGTAGLVDRENKRV